jgi:WD40 repeat protein
MSVIDLKIKNVIGFSGKIPNGLNFSPDGKYVVFPLGSFVVLKNQKTGKEAFLDGHSGEVSCITISGDGSKIASGQLNNTAGSKVNHFYFSLAVRICS